MPEILEELRERLIRIEEAVGSAQMASTSRLNVVRTLALYSPASAGAYEDLAPLTLQSAIDLPSCAVRLAGVCGTSPLQHHVLETFLGSPEDRSAAQALAGLLSHYGSDKAGPHDYHHPYGHILSRPSEISNVLEIGLGTNNTDVVSNMGSQGRPGASLRAFRDFLPNASVYGADFDKRILFTEERIQTFFVDQTDPETLQALAEAIPSGFDLIIDDGLHSPNANLNSLAFALPKLKIGGWAVIEDIHPVSVTIWELAAFLVQQNYQPMLFRGRQSYIFAAKRLR